MFNPTKTKQMKIALAFIIGFGIVYLTFAFGCADFNIKNWSGGARIFCASFGFFAGFTLAYIQYFNENV